MLINIITASRRIGDVIVCNKVDLKIKKAMRLSILSYFLPKDGNFLLNTSMHGCDRD